MKSLPSLDPKQLGVVVNTFSGAFIGTPEDDDLVTRTRKTLEALSDEVVCQLAEAVDVLATLTRERLAAADCQYPAEQ